MIEKGFHGTAPNVMSSATQGHEAMVVAISLTVGNKCTHFHSMGHRQARQNLLLSQMGMMLSKSMCRV